MGRRLLVLVVMAVSTSAASALTDEEVFRNFRFNLINPGARSLALGGAFISLADDATAAQANPAGLTFLARSEYFAEVRFVDNAAEASTRTERLPSAGVETFVATGTDIDDTVSPTFLSVVTTYGRWAMGLSRQEVLNINNFTLSSFKFTFEGEPRAFLTEGVGNIDLDVTNINVSVGANITDRLGVGATLTYSTLRVDSEVTNTIVDTGPADILEPTLDTRTTIDDRDDDVVFGLGLIYKWEKWSIGGVYRNGPDFSVVEYLEVNDDVDLGERAKSGRFSNRFHLPDSYGIGTNWRPTDVLTLSLDVERIIYSNLLDGYVSGVNILTGKDARFTIDDANNARLGAEYVFLNAENSLPPLALRGGVFTEGDSTIRAEFTGSESFATEEVFAGRDRQNHVALGLGIVLKRARVDLAADFSEFRNEYLVSFVYQSKN